MHVYTLTRTAETIYGTFGQLHTGYSTYQTVERQWLNNVKRHSCIPTGVYNTYTDMHRGKYGCIELEDVPGRSEIQIHVANMATQLLGCIAVGMIIGSYKGSWCVLKSRIAHNMLMDEYRAAKTEGIVLIHVKTRIMRHEI